jgi:hypothetical protein
VRLPVPPRDRRGDVVSSPSRSPESSQDCREGQHHACLPGWAGCDCWCHLEPSPCLDDLDDFTPAAEMHGDYLREIARETYDEGNAR